MLDINFKPLTDFEKLAYSNLYAIELKKKNDLLESRVIILIKQNKSLRKSLSKLGKQLRNIL